MSREVTSTFVTSREITPRSSRLGRSALGLRSAFGETSAAVVLVRLPQLFVGVHDERAAPRDGLVQRPPGEDEHAPRLRIARRGEAVAVASEDRELPAPDLAGDVDGGPRRTAPSVTYTNAL